MRVVLCLAAIALSVAFAADVAAQNRPRNYCACIKSCEAGQQRCERSFDEDCKKVPQPANCEPRVRQRCDQSGGLCSLDCSTAFRMTKC